MKTETKKEKSTDMDFSKTNYLVFWLKDYLPFLVCARAEPAQDLDAGL
jgi:hypothetical protein